ncbi:MAG: hypothetical protein FJX76_02845 [Armatimonadetes bacterium]|nr:hypothetical protein [Armatimonadota bacterium]
MRASRNFVPVFIDTLKDPDTERLGEMQGSYPVLRIFDHAENDLAGRLDGNPIQGHIPVRDILRQFQRGLEAFKG